MTTPESNRIEYKRDLTDTLEKEVVALLNYCEGGVIFRGLDNEESVIGLTVSDALQLKILEGDGVLITMMILIPIEQAEPGMIRNPKRTLLLGNTAP